MKLKHKITILGGTGFVGQHLCNALAQYPCEVQVLTRNPARYRELSVLPNVKLKAVNIFNPDALTHALHGCDTVINLVGILNTGGKNTFQKVHVELIKNLLHACQQQQQVQRLLHISALNASAEAPSEYLRTKCQAEQYIQVANTLNFHSTIFQPSVIFGPGDHFFNLFAKLIKYSPGIMLLPCADSLHAPVYVEDVVQAMLLSIDDKQTYGRIYPLSGPEIFSLKELVKITAYALEKKCYVIGLGPPLSKLAASILQYLPGKPLTPDNYLSSTLPSIAKESFPTIFDIEPLSVHNVLPSYLGKEALLDAYAPFRKRLPPQE